MKKLITTVRPVLHAWLGYLVLGALGRIVFALRVPFNLDALLLGPTHFSNPWPTEYGFIMMLVGIPGVLYAAAVAAASRSKRKATLVLTSVYALEAITIISVERYSRSSGVRFHPSLVPLVSLGALATLGAMFVFGLCVSLCTHGLGRKRRLLAAALMILVSFAGTAVVPEGMVAWHQASLGRIRPGLLSLDPQGEEHYLLRVRHANDKHALVQLGTLDMLDFVPCSGTTQSQETNFWEAIRADLGAAAYADATWTTTGFELPATRGGPPADTPLFRIWDRPHRAEFWAEVARKHGMQRLRQIE